MLGLWGSSREAACAIPGASGVPIVSPRQLCQGSGSPRTSDATLSRSDGFPSRLSLGRSADLRLTPAFAKSYGVATSRLYSLGAVKRWWLVVVIVIVLVLVGGGAAVYVDWTWKRKPSPRGGRPFLTRVELPVPSFQQGNDKWRDDSLGGVPENGTLGGEGCAVAAAAAMVFKFYGIDVDPQQLNWFATATGGIHRARLALLGSRSMVRARSRAARLRRPAFVSIN